MSWSWIAFFVGAIVGAAVAIVLMCFFIAGMDADAREEKMYETNRNLG